MNVVRLLQIRVADASFSLIRWQHSTLLHERLPFWNYDVTSKISLCCQSMHNCIFTVC